MKKSNDQNKAIIIIMYNNGAGYIDTLRIPTHSAITSTYVIVQLNMALKPIQIIYN